MAASKTVEKGLQARRPKLAAASAVEASSKKNNFRAPSDTCETRVDRLPFRLTFCCSRLLAISGDFALPPLLGDVTSPVSVDASP